MDSAHSASVLIALLRHSGSHSFEAMFGSQVVAISLLSFAFCIGCRMLCNPL
jgi:hypothetical protein